MVIAAVGLIMVPVHVAAYRERGAAPVRRGRLPALVGDLVVVLAFLAASGLGWWRAVRL